MSVFSTSETNGDDARRSACRGKCVAKLFAALLERNYQIRPNSTLSRCCAPALVFESILLNLVVKIVLQHIQGGMRTLFRYCPRTDFAPTETSAAQDFRSAKRLFGPIRAHSFDRKWTDHQPSPVREKYDEGIMQRS